MASDVHLMIFDPCRGTVVARRWLGMGQTVDKIRQVLGRPPDHAVQGYECWGQLNAGEAATIAEVRYVDGATAAEIIALGAAYPDDAYWWMLTRDF